MAKGKKTGGRRPGTPNKVTAEIRAAAQKLFDADYFAELKQRIRRGKAAPAVECRMLAYAFGEPPQTLETPGMDNLATLLARKVIHECHPGPTKGATDFHAGDARA